MTNFYVAANKSFNARLLEPTAELVILRVPDRDVHVTEFPRIGIDIKKKEQVAHSAGRVIQ